MTIPGAQHPASGVDRRGDAAPAPLPGAYESDPVHDTRPVSAPPRAEQPAAHAHTADGSAMDQPGPVLAMIAAAGLLVVVGAFVFALMLARQPEAPVGAVNVSPAAQQPIADVEGELLPVQPGAPEEGEPILNAPAQGAPASAPPAQAGTNAQGTTRPPPSQEQ